MELVTGKKGETHVTSLQFRNIVRALTGSDSYIANAYDNCAVALQDDGVTLQVSPGIIIHHGCVFEIPYGTLEEITLAAGTAGSKRRDLICIRWTQDETTGIESAAWVVLQGEPATNPVDPTYNDTNMQEGAFIDDCPVFRVEFNGLNVSGITRLIDMLPTAEGQETPISTLSSDVGALKASVTALQTADTTINKTLTSHTNSISTLTSKTNTMQGSITTLQTAKNLNVNGSYGLSVKFWRRGNVVFVHVGGTPTNLTEGWKNICKVTNSNFIPSASGPYDTRCAQAISGQTFLINMQSDGNLRINPTAKTITGYINVTYVYFM
jgi:hypothetical protein